MATQFRTSPQVQTSPIYKIRGQRSRWHYPHERLTPEHTISSKNVNLSERGNTEARDGYRDWNELSGNLAGSESVQGLIYAQGWSSSAYGGSDAMEEGWVVVTPTKMYYDAGITVTGWSTRTDITGATALSAGGIEDRIRHTYAQNRLIMTNGKDTIRIHNLDFSGTPDNASVLTFTDVTLDTCLDIITHKNVVMAVAPTVSGTYHPTRVMWCDVNRKTFELDITTWQDVNRFEIYEGGPPIVGAVDNFGLALIFKEDGMYPTTFVYDVGFIELRIAEETIRRGFSPVAKNSLIARPEFVFGIAKEGAFVITPDLQYQFVTADVQDKWDELDPERLKYAVSWFREKDHQVRTLVSKESSTGHDRVLVWDWDSGEVWFDEYTDDMNFAASARLAGTEYDWLGGKAGGLWAGNYPGQTSDDGTAFPWEVEMAPNDLGLPGRQKTILNVRTIYRRKTGQGDIVLTVNRDQGRKRSRRKTIALSSSQEQWNGGGTYNSGLRYDLGQNAEDDFFVNRQAETISPTYTGNTPADLIGYQVEYIPEE